MPAKHYIIVLLLPKDSEAQNKFYNLIYCILILCRQSFKTDKEFGYPTKFVVTGFDLYTILNDYGYSYAVITRTVSS